MFIDFQDLYFLLAVELPASPERANFRILTFCSGPLVEAQGLLVEAQGHNPDARRQTRGTHPTQRFVSGHEPTPDARRMP